MKMTTGLLRPDCGTVEVCGISMQADGRRARQDELPERQGRRQDEQPARHQVLQGARPEQQPVRQQGRGRNGTRGRHRRHAKP